MAYVSVPAGAGRSSGCALAAQFCLLAWPALAVLLHPAEAVAAAVQLLLAAAAAVVVAFLLRWVAQFYLAPVLADELAP